MHDTLIPVLLQQGMSEKEAVIYLAVLQRWSAPASTIARKVGIKRVTTYSILRDLERKQIASTIEKKWVTYFQVIDPVKLLDKLKEKISTLEQKIPELLALTDIYHHKPKIQYFEGLSGVKDMYEDLLTSSQPIYSFLGMNALSKDLEQYLVHDFLPRRLQRHIFAQVLVSSKDRDLEYQSRDQQYFKETRVVKSDLFGLVTEINLYGPGKVAIALFSDDEMSAIIIHSPRLYESMMSIFMTLREWSTYDKK